MCVNFNLILNGLLNVGLLSGDITQKGYEKKRTRLLAPYIAQQQQSQGKLFKFDAI